MLRCIEFGHGILVQLCTLAYSRDLRRRGVSVQVFVKYGPINLYPVSSIKNVDEVLAISLSLSFKAVHLSRSSTGIDNEAIFFFQTNEKWVIAHILQAL